MIGSKIIRQFISSAKRVAEIAGDGRRDRRDNRRQASFLHVCLQ